MTSPSRRDVIAAFAALGLAPVLPAAGATGPRLGPKAAFSFDGLVEAAKSRAALPHAPMPVRAAEALERIDYDDHWKIRFRADHTVEAASGKAPLRFFHLGRFFKQPVGIHLVDRGEAQAVLYDRDYFEMPDDSPARGLPADIGFAGFRVMEPGVERDWLAFLGAAYFRSSGALDQYGLSARAIAIDTAMPTPEEFPRFTDFYFAASETADFAIYAGLEGPSVSGAVRWDVTRGGDATGRGVTMDMSVRFFARKDVGRLGLAALTSMFWYAETNRQRGRDWRPEIHDSDGLAIHTGAGERLWRPLNNPRQVMTSSFVDSDVRGFGLMQRDRSFENYQDDGVFYEKRPSVWIEPRGGWGQGAVQLVEIPTDDEIHDNIVVYWVPERPVRAGDEVAVDYRITWYEDDPSAPAIGRVTSTRLGLGGAPGTVRPKGVVRFAVDFEGGQLADLGADDGVMPEVTASTGTVDGAYALPVVGTGRWRAIFDYRPDGTYPVELRLFLTGAEGALTETWAYQHHGDTFTDPG